MRLVLNEEATGQPHTARWAMGKLLASLVLCIAMLSPVLPAHASTGSAARVLSIEHSIDFGRGIEVRLEAEVDAAVTEVRAVFAPQGERTVSSYSYAAFSQQGALLEAEFTITTAGSSYFPPGTEFEVIFELTAADGSVESTEPVRFFYLDPQRDWQTLSRDGIPLDFYYYGLSRSSIEAMADRVAASWDRIAAATGTGPGAVGRFRAVIYPNLADFTPASPPISAAASEGVFFGGFAMQEYGVFVLGSPTAGSVVHEFTHLMVDSAVNSPLSPGAPSWLHEGLAQFFEAGSSEFYSSQLGPAARSGSLLVLRNRNTVPARAEEIGLFYTQAGSFVGGLIERHGPEMMAQTLRLINGGKSATEAMGEAYGRPFWELENEWRVSLGAAPLPSPDAAPAAGETPEAQDTATPVGGAPDGASIGVDTPPASDSRGFNWSGPIIGGAVAVAVFIGWSVKTNRKRFWKRKRE